MNKRFDFDKENIEHFKYLIGTDEAGRGPGAGPVFAAAVCFKDIDEDVVKLLSKLDDSKQLSEKVRDELFDVIILYDTLPYIANKLDVVTELYTTNLNIGGRLAIFHSRGEEQINQSLAHGDRRICDSYLPIFDNYLNELYNKGCKVIYSTNKSDDYTILLIKDA